ncbi:MAG: hypothetical protein HFJ72_08295 [Adlercreutzia sp.]|nr:hypothetical protein [Adlercreutzia sp.]
MDEAAVHAVDSLGGSGPGWLLAAGILAILAIVAIRALPAWQKLREKQIEAETEHKKAQLDIERDREIRKMGEAQMRNEREIETAAIQARMVESQDRATAAMTALNQQMAVMNSQLEMSRDRSALMGTRVDEIAIQVDDIHGVIVRKDEQ